MKKTYVQDDTGKFVEKSQTKHRLHFVQRDSGDVVSPDTGLLITGNVQLREHEKRTGLTNDLDSLRDKAQAANHTNRPATSRRVMRDAIADSIERASSSGFHREIRYDE